MIISLVELHRKCIILLCKTLLTHFPRHKALSLSASQAIPITELQALNVHPCLVLESILVIYMLWFSWSVPSFAEEFCLTLMKCPSINLHQRIPWENQVKKVTVCVFMVDNFLPLQFQISHDSVWWFSHHLFSRKTGTSLIIQCTWKWHWEKKSRPCNGCSFFALMLV